VPYGLGYSLQVLAIRGLMAAGFSLLSLTQITGIVLGCLLLQHAAAIQVCDASKAAASTIDWLKNQHGLIKLILPAIGF
jgi:hypothetical protein